MNFISKLLIITLPFWSLPFLPGTYSAITPYICLIIFPFYIINKKGGYEFKWIMINVSFCILLVFYSLISFSNGTLSFLDFFGYIMGYISFFSFIFVFTHLRIEKCLMILLSVSKLVSFYAIFEAVVSRVDFLKPLKVAITFIFTGKESEGLILTTNEPSWAVQLLLFCSVFLFLDYLKNGKKGSLFFVLTNLCIFIVTFSMTGLLVLLLACVFYQLLFRSLSIKILCKLLFLSAVIIASFTIVFTFFNSGGYTYARIDKFLEITSTDVSALYYSIIRIDNSLLIRIGYPVVGFNMFLDNPFGLGVSGFSYYLNDYLHLLNSPVMYDSELTKHLENLNADARNYIIALCVDFGVFGLLLVLYCLLTLRNIIKNLGYYFLPCAMLFSLSLGVMMQFSTFYFFLYPLTLAMILTAKKRETL